MALVTTGFEDGTPGATVGTTFFTNVIATGTGASFKYDATHTAHGAMAAMLTPVASSPVYGQKTGLSSTAMAARIYVYMTSLATDDTYLIQFLSGSTRTASLHLQGTGKLRLLNTGATALWTATNTLPLNQWVRIELYATISATAATLTVGQYSLDSGTATESFTTSTGNTGSSAWTVVALGKFSSGAYATPFWMDDAAYDPAATGLLGAVVGPTAAFTATPSGLSAAFDSTGSSEPGGTVAYAWAFGDGATSTAANPTHNYSTSGTYTATLTVTGTSGLTASVSHSVTVAAGNASPTAAFTWSANGLAVAFNGTSSTDPDGTIASYAWTFGDSGTATTASPSHTYSTAGTYTVTLTVTDNLGATGSTSHTLTVTTSNPGQQNGCGADGATATGSAGTGASFTLAKPSNLGDGDYVVAQFQTNVTGGTMSTVPSGWTALSSQNAAGLSAIYYKYVPTASTEPSSYAFAASGSGRNAAQLFRVYGADPTTFVDVLGAFAGPSGSTTITDASLTTTTANDCLLAFTFAQDTTTTDPTITAPSGWSTFYAYGPNTSSSVTVAVSQKVQATAGTTGSLVFTFSQAQGSMSRGILAAIKANPANNQPPTANAGTGLTALEPYTVRTHDGSGSTDTDGTIATYQWRVVSNTTGGTVTLSSTSAQKPTWTVPATITGGTVVSGLIVVDNTGASSAEATVTDTVAPHTVFRITMPGGVLTPAQASRL